MGNAAQRLLKQFLDVQKLLLGMILGDSCFPMFILKVRDSATEE
jgi:hypothetical protein